MPQWRVPRSPRLSLSPSLSLGLSLKEDFFGCTRADLQRGARRTDGQFWVPFAEIRMIAAQGIAPQSSKSDRG